MPIRSKRLRTDMASRLKNDMTCFHSSEGNGNLGEASRQDDDEKERLLVSLAAQVEDGRLIAVRLAVVCVVDDHRAALLRRRFLKATVSKLAPAPKASGVKGAFCVVSKPAAEGVVRTNEAFLSSASTPSKVENRLVVIF